MLWCNIFTLNIILDVQFRNMSFVKTVINIFRYVQRLKSYNLEIIICGSKYIQIMSEKKDT